MDVLVAGGLALFKYLVSNNPCTRQNIHLVDSEDDVDLSSTFESEIAGKSLEEISHPHYQDYKYHSMSNVGKTKSEYVDVHKEIKDIFTTFVTEHFFKTPECMFNFLEEVVTTYTKAIEEYRVKHSISPQQLFFIYKGGNVLRIVARDFLAKLPSPVNSDLVDMYEKYFGRSDSDFAIYISPTVKDYNRVYRDMTLTSFVLQVHLRERFFAEPSKYFDYFKYSTSYQQVLLSELVLKISNSNAVRDPANEFYNGKIPTGISFGDVSVGQISSYSGRKDIGIQFSRDESKINIYALNDRENLFYISMNEALKFFSSETAEFMIKFNLVRTKAVFNIAFGDEIVKSAGELIDVSIAHRDEYKLVEFFKYGYSNAVHNYKMRYGTRSLDFTSYSLHELAFDLRNIIFVETLPWTDSKYVKRLYRLYFLYLIDMFTRLPTIADRRDLLISLYNAIVSRDSVVEKLSALHDKYPDLLISNLFTDLVVVTEKMSTDDEGEFVRLLQYITDNINISLHILDKLQTYTKTNATIDEDELYNTRFNSLIGGNKTQSGDNK